MAKQTVVICADSQTPEGTRITTFILRYWRAFHAELMTHRDFSRNAGSSRAIPTPKILKQVWSDAAGPTYWGSNKPGMQAGAQLTGWRLWLAKVLWQGAAKAACVFAWALNKVGLHKQYANRPLEPYQYISVMVTSTRYDNFFKLRDHKDAMPEFRDLARDMKSAMYLNLPVKLKHGEWHLPLIKQYERGSLPIPELLKISAARNARTSYERHDGTPAMPSEDFDLHERLVGGDPIHASPTEHQVLYVAPHTMARRYSDKLWDLQGNLRGPGIVQYRKLIENPDAKEYYLNVMGTQ